MWFIFWGIARCNYTLGYYVIPYCVPRVYVHTVCADHTAILCAQRRTQYDVNTCHDANTCLCVDVVYLLVENWLLTIDPAGIR